MTHHKQWSASISPETEAAKWSAGVINYIIYTWALPTVVCQCICRKNYRSLWLILSENQQEAVDEETTMAGVLVVCN